MFFFFFWPFETIFKSFVLQIYFVAMLTNTRTKKHLNVFKSWALVCVLVCHTFLLSTSLKTSAVTNSKIWLENAFGFYVFEGSFIICVSATWRLFGGRRNEGLMLHFLCDSEFSRDLKTRKSCHVQMQFCFFLNCKCAALCINKCVHTGSLVQAVSYIFPCELRYFHSPTKIIENVTNTRFRLCRIL